MYQSLVTAFTAFVGASVESVEALTIILAVGLTAGWRPALQGAAVALVALAALVAGFGGIVVGHVSDTVLQLVIGTLILLFGVRWLHKAMLRSAGVIALHNEQAIFDETRQELELRRERRSGRAVAFQGTLLEGVEVVFIVFGLGTTGHSFGAAVFGAVLAVLVVAALGSVLRHPLTAVPENLLKVTVGVALCSLGTFWAAEGAGVHWPLDAGSLPLVAAAYVLTYVVTVATIRSPQMRAAA